MATQTPDNHQDLQAVNQESYLSGDGIEESLGIRFRRYYYVILSKWWLILLLLLAGGAIGYYRCVTQTPVYRSQCVYELVSGSELSLLGKSGSAADQAKGFGEWVDRQLMLISSSEIKSRVRDNLKPEWESRVPPGALTPSISVRKSGDIASMIEIRVDSVVREYALAYIEELLTVFEDFKQEQVLRHKEQTVSKLRDEERKIREDLEEAREELATFEREHNISFTRLKSHYDEQYLARLVQRQNALRMERTQLSTQFPFLRDASSATIRDVLSLNIETHKLATLPEGGGGRTVPAGGGGDQSTEGGSMDSEAPWSGKQAQLLKLQAEYEEMAKLCRPQHPLMKDLKKQIRETEQELKIDAESGLSRLRSRYMALEIQAKSLDKAARDWDGDVQLSSHEQAQYDQLKAKVTHYRSLHDQVYSRILDSSLVDVSGSYGYLVKEPYMYKLPVRPDKKKTMAFSLLFALCAGVGLSVFLEKLRLGGTSEGAVEKRLGIPFLSGIPNWKNKSREFRKDKDRVIVSQDRHDIATEVYRGLRSTVERAIGDHPDYALLITSDLQKTGKTLTCLNLGVVTAWIGKRVLMVDGDLRKGRLGRDLGVDHKKGLAQLLKGQVWDWRGLIQSTEYENLEVMASGQYSHDLPELLTVERIKPYFDEWRKEYDLVIVDSAPAGYVVDSAALAAVCDGTLLVLRHTGLELNSVRHAVHNLGSENLLGYCLNNITAPKKKDYYSYQYFNRYYYYTPYVYGGNGKYAPVDAVKPEKGKHLLVSP